MEWAPQQQHWPGEEPARRVPSHSTAGSSGKAAASASRKSYSFDGQKSHASSDFKSRSLKASSHDSEGLCEFSPGARGQGRENMDGSIVNMAISMIVVDGGEGNSLHKTLKHPAFHLRDTDVQISDKILGKGADATVFSGTWKGKPVAIKLFHDSGTQSDNNQTRNHGAYIREVQSYHNVASTRTMSSADISMLKASTMDSEDGFQDEHRHHNSSTLLAERINLSEAHHPHMVEFYGASFARPMFVFELMEGGALDTLLATLKSRGEAPPRKSVYKWSKGCLLALQYLHDEVGIIHRDVKPANVLLSKDYSTAKLGDFSVSGIDDKVKEGESVSRTESAESSPLSQGWGVSGSDRRRRQSKLSRKGSGMKGTPRYMAPEILMNPGAEYTEKVDIYGAAMTF